MIKKVFLFLSIGVFASTLGDGIVSPLLPLYIQGLGATGMWLGLIVAASFISNAIAIPITGRLSDRKGRKPFLAAGFLAISIISLGYLWATSMGLLAVVRLVHGAAGALVGPIALAYIGDLSPEGEEGKWMGYANATFFSGFGLGPSIGGVLADRFGMSASFITMSSLNLFSFLVVLLFLPEVVRRKSTETPEISFRQLSASSMVKALFSFRLTQSLGFGGLGTYLPILAAGIGLANGPIGVLLSVNILAVTLFTPAVGLIADRISRRMLTITGSLLLSVFFVFVPFAGSFWLLLVVLILQGLSTSVCATSTSALVVDEGRRYGMGSMMSMLFLSMSIGMAIGPIASGGIAQVANINWVFYFGGFMCLVGTALFAWFTRTTKKVAA